MKKRAFLLSSSLVPFFYAVPSIALSEEGDDASDEFICSTPNFTDFDAADQGLILELYSDGFDEIDIDIGTGSNLEPELYQLGKKSDAWKASDGLKGSLDSEILIGVNFLNGTERQHQKVIEVAEQWTTEDGAPIKFVFGNSEKFHIRVKFNATGNNSMIGRQARLQRDKTKPTMNLREVYDGRRIKKRERRVILHEFGHALGLRHEHKHPSSGILWNEEVVIEAMKGQPIPWSEKKTRLNILDAYSGKSYLCRGASDYDAKSIMSYQFPRSWIKQGTPVKSASSTLSVRDLLCARSLHEG